MVKSKNIVVSLLLTVLFIACTTESSITENPETIQKEKKVLDILDQVKEIANNNGKSYSFTIAFNKQQEGYWLQEMTELNNKVGVDGAPAPGGAYQVDCYNGEGDLIWSETYDDRDDAGTAIIICTDEGGCAEICEVHARYFFQGNQ